MKRKAVSPTTYGNTRRRPLSKSPKKATSVSARGGAAKLDHYFRNLDQIIKFIDGSPIPEPRRYTSLVRAQLSPAELILLSTMACVTAEKFKPLMEKYAMLEQLPAEESPQPNLRGLDLPRLWLAQPRSRTSGLCESVFESVMKG